MTNLPFLRNLILIPIISLMFASCSNGKNSEKLRKLELKARFYDSLNIPEFFKTFCQNHIETYSILYFSEFQDFCSANDLNTKDSINKTHYFSLKILHDLFTSQNASNGSMGEISKIPYFWHWTSPNPRYTIRFTENNSLLKDSKPPLQFAKYQSFADIDRTPYLFLSDWLSPEFRYYSKATDSFSTFGWCSEREMAFVCLTTLLGYQGKVVTSGNHSWSELTVSMGSKQETSLFRVKIDNTFNSVQWTKTDKKETELWLKELGSSQLPKWYNQKAYSKEEAIKLRNHVVSKKAMQRLENQMIVYLTREANR
jgi:hypothetical protein